MFIDIHAWCATDGYPIGYALERLSSEGHNMATTSEFNAWLFDYGWILTDSSVDRQLSECDKLSIRRISEMERKEIAVAKSHLSSYCKDPSRCYCSEYLQRIELSRFGREEDYVRLSDDYRQWVAEKTGESKVDEDSADMKAPEETPYDRRKRQLDTSFNETVEQMGIDDPGFSDVYEWMQPYIAAIDFKDCFVDCSRARRWVDFNLACKNEYFVSVTGRLDADDHIVYFAIARDRENLIIDQDNLEDLKGKINEALDIIEEKQSLWNP